MKNTLKILLALAVVIGLYALAAGIGGVLSPKRWHRMIGEWLSSRMLQYLSGLIALLLGAAIILLVPVGRSMLPILVVVIGWTALIEGVLMLAAPDLLLRMVRGVGASGLSVYAWASVFLGALLLVAGWSSVQRERAAMIPEPPVAVSAPDTPAAPSAPTAPVPPSAPKPPHQ